MVASRPSRRGSVSPAEPARGACRWSRAAARVGVPVPALVLLSLAVSGAQPAVDPPDVLVPGSAVERRLSPGEEHHYRLPAGAVPGGGSWLVSVEQLGIDVVLEVREEPGEEGRDPAVLAAVDGPTNRYGEESVVLAAAAEPRRVVVRVTSGETKEAAYRLRLALLPVDSPRDRLRLEAETALSDAGRLMQDDDPATRRLAREHCMRALVLGRELDDLRQQARGQHCAGVLSRRLDEPAQATAALEAAVELWRAAGEVDLEITALNELGLALWQSGDLPAAQDLFQRGLAVSLEHDRRPLEAASRSNLCLVLHYQGDLDAARPCYEAALRLAEELGIETLQATLLTNLGGVHYLRGEPSPAREYYARALEMQRAAENISGQAALLNNLAALHVSTGEYQQALLDYERSLEAYRVLGDRRGEARTLNNLGHTFQLFGEPQRARTFYEQALPLRRATEDRRGEAVTLNNLGTLMRLEGDAEAALRDHQEALELHRSLGSQRDEAITRELIGQAMLELGRPAEALAELDTAVTSLAEIGDRRRLAAAHRHRAEARAELGQETARADLSAALDLYRSAGDRVGLALTELAQAHLERAARRPAAAVAHTENAIVLLEDIRAGVDTPDLRASFLASQRSAYELLIDLQVDQGEVERALETAEAASARTLLDAVHETAVALPSSIDPELAGQRDEAERRLRVKTDRRLDLDPSREPEQVAALDAEIDALLSELDAVEARIRRADARYAQLTQPPLLTAGGMRRLLDGDTLLLRFSLGKEASYLWRVTEEAVSVHRLPPRSEVEELARAAHDALRQPAGDAAARAAAALAEQVLGPVAASLDRRRILVVADGALHYVPFAALPVPGSPDELLLDAHEVVTAPSMSVLALQRQVLEQREGAPRTLAVIADPVFDPGDHRVVTRGQAEEQAVAGAGEPASVERGQGFARLRFSRREAEVLAALVPADERFVALDFAASRQTVLSGVLAPYRIVHFATHGVLDSQRPELSALVLSRVDADGRPLSGLLGLRDIYDLDLGADLVVLSGCRTALGREVQGEGLVGLTRGFLYAGVPRVVASLWPVDDRATAELMSAFYRSLLLDGLPPGEALTHARRELRAQRRTRAPYYWAPFILQGDWRLGPDGKTPPAEDTSRQTP